MDSAVLTNDASPPPISFNGFVSFCVACCCCSSPSSALPSLSSESSSTLITLGAILGEKDATGEETNRGAAALADEERLPLVLIAISRLFCLCLFSLSSLRHAMSQGASTRTTSGKRCHCTSVFHSDSLEGRDTRDGGRRRAEDSGSRPQRWDRVLHVAERREISLTVRNCAMCDRMASGSDNSVVLACCARGRPEQERARETEGARALLKR